MAFPEKPKNTQKKAYKISPPPSRILENTEKRKKRREKLVQEPKKQKANQQIENGSWRTEAEKRFFRGKNKQNPEKHPVFRGKKQLYKALPIVLVVQSKHNIW